jgi:hypothetical protein
MAHSDENDVNNTDQYDEAVFDTDRGTRLTLSEPTTISDHDLRNLRNLEAVECDIERRDGERIVTECELNVDHLAKIAAELDTVERKLGDRWERTGWNAPLDL